LVIFKVSFEESKGGQSDVGEASRRGQLLWDERTVTQDNLAESFRVTQRLAVS